LLSWKLTRELGRDRSLLDQWRQEKGQGYAIRGRTPITESRDRPTVTCGVCRDSYADSSYPFRACGRKRTVVEQPPESVVRKSFKLRRVGRHVEVAFGAQRSINSRRVGLISCCLYMAFRPFGIRLPQPDPKLLRPVQRLPPRRSGLRLSPTGLFFVAGGTANAVLTSSRARMRRRAPVQWQPIDPKGSRKARPPPPDPYAGIRSAHARPSSKRLWLGQVRTEAATATHETQARFQSPCSYYKTGDSGSMKGPGGSAAWYVCEGLPRMVDGYGG